MVPQVKPADISSRIVLAMRDYAAIQIGQEVATEVFEHACQTTSTDLEDASDARGWVSIEMFHKLAEGLGPLVSGDLISEAVIWVVPRQRELSSMSLTAIAKPRLFYGQLDRARAFYAKHLHFDVKLEGAAAATAILHYRQGSERRPESCAVALGVLSSIPLLFNLPIADVEETECYADGGKTCTFHVSWKQTGHAAAWGAGLGALTGVVGAVLTPSLWWLAAPLGGWLVGKLVLATERRRHLAMVVEEQRTSLASAERDLERRFREVHELKATLETLERTQTEILDAGVQALLGELVGEFAHEMRNPLSAVLFNLSFLEGETSPDGKPQTRSTDIEEVDAVLTDIRYGVERMRGVLSWFVDVFRSGGQEPGLISLSTEVERAANLLKREWVGRIEIHVETHPTPMIRSFGKEIVQVLVNLLVNAAHATRRGNIWISTTHDPTTDTVSLTIRDDGDGMSADVLERAFERGYTTKGRPDRGRGLGLFICKRITNRNGGSIELTSAIGKGTSAIVTFPAATNVDAPAGLGPGEAYAP